MTDAPRQSTNPNGWPATNWWEAAFRAVGPYSLALAFMIGAYFYLESRDERSDAREGRLITLLERTFDLVGKEIVAEQKRVADVLDGIGNDVKVISERQRSLEGLKGARTKPPEIAPLGNP